MTEKNYPSYLDNPKPTRKQTNYERIKNMSIEEMASFMGEKPYCTLKNGIDCIYGWHDCKCKEHAKEWLESEVSSK